MKASDPHIVRVKRDLDAKFRKFDKKWPLTPGMLGDDNGVVQVPGRPNYVYVRATQWNATVICYNAIAPTIRDTPVYIGYNEQIMPSVLQVLEVRNIQRPTDQSMGWNSATVQSHHQTHEYPFGSDIVWTQKRQYMPGRVYPAASSASAIGGNWTVTIVQDIYRISGSVTYVPTTNIDLFPYVPTATAGGSTVSGSAINYARWILVSIGPTTTPYGNILISAGSIVSGSAVNNLNLIPPTPINGVDLAAVLLIQGQTKLYETITQSSVLDLRGWGGGFRNGSGQGTGLGNTTTGGYLRRDAQNEPVTGHLDINANHANAFRVQSAVYTAGSQISSGSIDVTSDAGRTISGLTIGNWYAVETFGGPWSPWPDVTPSFYTFSSSNDGGATWSGWAGYIAAIPGDWQNRFPTSAMYVDIPYWATYYEIVSTYYVRYYFQATTTSILVRPADYSNIDNIGTLSYKLSSATAVFGQALNVDTVTGYVSASALISPVATAGSSGLLPKLSGNPLTFLSGSGTWLVPASGSGGSSGSGGLSLGGATPQPVGVAAVGTSGSASHEDHVHSHGSQGSGSQLHGIVTTGSAGFMPVLSGNPAQFMSGSGTWLAPPTSGSLSLGGATPQAVGVAAVGTSGSASHEDHVHAHGAQGSGSQLHSIVSSGSAGFVPALSGVPAQFLSGSGTWLVPAGSGGVSLGAATPQSLGVATVGTSGSASHEDHVHAHGSLGSGSQIHSIVSSGSAGFAPALSGNPAQFLSGSGTWLTPAGSGSSTLSGSSIANYVTYWANGSTVTGGSALYWDSTGPTLLMGSPNYSDTVSVGYLFQLMAPSGAPTARWVGHGQAPSFNLWRSDGIYGSGSPLLPNEQIGNLYWLGRQPGANAQGVWNYGGYIRGITSGSWSAGSTGMNIQIGVTPTTGSSPATMLTIAGTGIGIITTSPGLDTTAGRGYLTVNGSTDRGVVQLTSAVADSDGASLGNFEWVDSNSTNTHARVAFIQGLLSGATAGKRGSIITFFTKPDNDAGAGNEVVRIDNAGKVGINTTAPKQLLDVVGQGLFRSATISYDPGDSAGNATRIGFLTSGSYGYIVANQTGVSSRPLILNPSGGNVGIGGTAIPSYPLDITGSLRTSTGFGCNGTTPQTAYASGGALAAYGAGANGFDTAAHASALYAMVVSIRAALVANGIMS